RVTKNTSTPRHDQMRLIFTCKYVRRWDPTSATGPISLLNRFFTCRASERCEGLQRVGELVDIFAFVSATMPVVWNVAENPLRRLARHLAAQHGFPVFSGPKHQSPLCFWCARTAG